jgi:hypothetical protein
MTDTKHTMRSQVIARLLSDDLFRRRTTARLHKSTDKNGPGGCWLWTGGTATGDYGTISLTIPMPGGARFRRATISTHRLAYALAKGDPGDQHILHSCDVRRCVNPDHLTAGTHADNMRDMVAKGRHQRATPKGDAVTTAKHSNADALKVAELHRAGRTSLEIVAETGFKYHFVVNVASGRAWSDITGLPRRVSIKRSAKPRPRRAPSQRRRWMILGCLAEHGPLDTGALASLVGARRDATLSACIALERAGRLQKVKTGVGLATLWEVRIEAAKSEAA